MALFRFPLVGSFRFANPADRCAAIRSAQNPSNTFATLVSPFVAAHRQRIRPPASERKTTKKSRIRISARIKTLHINGSIKWVARRSGLESSFIDVRPF